MPTSGLAGPYPLTEKGVDSNVTLQGAGAYALGKTKSNGIFHIAYIGRSDTDLNDRLHDHVGNYDEFKFKYYPSVKAAFEKECHLYHDFTPSGNDVHPAKPKGTDHACPVCDD